MPTLSKNRDDQRALALALPCERRILEIAGKAFAVAFRWERRALALRKNHPTKGALAPGLLFNYHDQTFSSPSLVPGVCLPIARKNALASEVGLGFSPGIKTHPRTGALAPEVCLPAPHKTNHRKLLFSFTLTATLITSCDHPKPIPKTTTNNLQLTTRN